MTGSVFSRRSIRLKDYDYSQEGGYYVTSVTFRHECLFGEVSNGVMVVNPLGKIVQEEWFRSSSIRKEISLFEDEFVIMPDHIHGIVWIDANPVGADGVRLDKCEDGVCPDKYEDGVRPDKDAGAKDQGAYHAPLLQRKSPKLQMKWECSSFKN